MAVQNPLVKGGFEPPVMSLSGVVLAACVLSAVDTHALMHMDASLPAQPYVRVRAAELIAQRAKQLVDWARVYVYTEHKCRGRTDVLVCI
jgi:hypothetical protein